MNKAENLIAKAHVVSDAPNPAAPGVSSMKGLANALDEGVRKSDIFPTDPRLIKVERGFNTRDLTTPKRQAYIRGLAESYKQGKYVPPIAVRVEAGNIFVVEGECRLTGALIAISEGADALMINCVQHKGNEVERTETMLRTGQDENPLSPLEVAMGIKRMNGWNLTNAEISDRIGKTPQHVEQMLLLANAPLDVQNMVREEKVAAATAIEVLRKHGEGAGKVLAASYEKAVSAGKSKVTPSHVREPKVPPRLASAAITAVKAVVGGLPSEVRIQLAELENAAPESFAGKTIAVDAAALLALVKAHGEVEDAIREKAQKIEDEARAAGQQQLAVGNQVV